jgi:hypothetical protein
MYTLKRNKTSNASKKRVTNLFLIFKFVKAYGLLYLHLFSSHFF